MFFVACTLFLAFYPREIPLRLLWLVVSIVLQFLALVWYSMSFIPYAREMLVACCRTTCCSGIIPNQVRDVCFVVVVSL